MIDIWHRVIYTSEHLIAYILVFHCGLLDYRI